MGKLLGGLTGGSSGGSTSTSSSSKPWEVAIPALTDILKNAGQLYDEHGGIKGDWIDKKIADLTPEMQSAVKQLVSSDEFRGIAKNVQEGTSGAVSGVNEAANYLRQIAGGSQDISGKQVTDLAGQLYQSDLVKSQEEALAGDVNEQLKAGMHDIDQQASSTGNMGSSRAGVAQGVAQGKASKAIAQGSAQIRNAAMQNAMGQAGNLLAGNVAQRAAGVQGLGSIGATAGNLQSQAGSLYGQALQNQLTGAGITQNQAQNVAGNEYYNQLGQQNAGWENLSKYLGMAGPIGGMGGTSTGTGSAGQGVSDAMGGIGGLATAVGGIGKMFGFSDASLKTDVKRVKKGGKGKDAEYTWKWNKSGENMGLKGKAKGALAQEVAKANPNAVARDPRSGKLMVDYSAIGG